MAPLSRLAPVNAISAVTTVLFGLNRRHHHLKLKLFDEVEDSPAIDYIFAKELVFFIISCCGSAFLCMMFGKWRNSNPF
jgi:hypothetical protein